MGNRSINYRLRRLFHVWKWTRNECWTFSSSTFHILFYVLAEQYIVIPSYPFVQTVGTNFQIHLNFILFFQFTFTQNFRVIFYPIVSPIQMAILYVLLDFNFNLSVVIQKIFQVKVEWYRRKYYTLWCYFFVSGYKVKIIFSIILLIKKLFHKIL